MLRNINVEKFGSNDLRGSSTRSNFSLTAAFAESPEGRDWVAAAAIFCALLTLLRPFGTDCGSELQFGNELHFHSSVFESALGNGLILDLGPLSSLDSNSALLTTIVSNRSSSGKRS